MNKLNYSILTFFFLFNIAMGQDKQVINKAVSKPSAKKVGQEFSLTKRVAVQAEGSRINCSKDPKVFDCCGLNSFACTGTGNPITLSIDQMKGFSNAELLSDGRVLVTNTFEETNWSESTFKTFISTKVAELKVEATASPALLREVYKEAKITGFPENVTIKPQKVNVNIEGQGHVNNKIRFIQQYYIDKSGDTKLAHTIQVK